MIDQKLLDRINKFLEDKTFRVPDPFRLGSDILPIDVKIKLEGNKEYIRVGEYENHIEYTIYVVGPEENKKDINQFLFFNQKSLPINTSSNTLPFARYYIDSLLKNFLKYFGVEDDVICTEIINDMENQISESILREDRYDPLVRRIVRDIVDVYKNNAQGNFYLPSNEDNDGLYSSGNLNDFNVELELMPDDNVDGFEIESNFYREEDVMEITIVYNPQYQTSIIYDLIGDLNDIVRHELQHSIQHMKGFEFPKKDPKTPFKYYTQDHEIEAQKKGFRRVAKLQKRPLEQVVRSWFNRHRSRHRLNDKEMEIVINKILQWI